jgi:cytoskeleton protein RodZ
MAPGIGQRLREARIRRGIELSQVEQVTKIRAKYLCAMEEDRWELLPGHAYARGFLSTYAGFLELDETALVAEYRRRHERVEDMEPIPEEMLPRRGVVRKAPIRSRVVALVGLIAAAVLGVVAVIELTGGSGDSGHATSRAAGPKPGGTSPAATSTTTPPVAQPARISLQLRSVGTVWVCLIGDRGRVLVNGETLTADEVRGPFEADAFKVTFGNGSMQMKVDGKPVEVPQVAEPLGYQITSQGLTELNPSSRPTCV